VRRKGDRVWLKVWFSIFLCLAIAEVGGRVAWLLRHGEFFSAGEAWKGQNAFAAEAGATLAGYTATLASHPYLAHVHKPGPSVNRQGLYGRDFPESRNPKVFQVLVTGGSVACQLAGVQPESGALCRKLEEKYVAADGRPIRVYNGADGGWKLPQQSIQILLNANRFDLVINIDGFNEHYVVKGDSYYLEMPCPNYRTVSPLGFHHQAALVGLWAAGALTRGVEKTPGLNRLWLGYAFGRGSVALAQFVDKRSRSAQNPTTLFQYPPGQDGDNFTQERQRAQLSELRRYLQLNAVIARQQGCEYASFLQPCPAIGKALTPEERRKVGDLGYADVYGRMEEAYRDAGRRGNYPFLSLVEVFSKTAQSVYADQIHCEMGADSPGYRIVSQAIADGLVSMRLVKPLAQ